MQDHSPVAYCGLFCGDCIIRERRIWSLSKDLLQRLRTPEFRKLAAGLPKLSPELKDLNYYDQCCSALAAIVDHIHCEEVCRDGGGSSDCRIRRCCREKGIQGCWTCGELEACETLAWLEPVHVDAHLRNLRKIRDFGMEAFLEGQKHW